eukprot:Sspe_Gene.53048::Locus_29349_Transcript_1_1_Confidence_1.000_Length_2059::g.53048::m.53048
MSSIPVVANEDLCVKCSTPVSAKFCRKCGERRPSLSKTDPGGVKTPLPAPGPLPEGGPPSRSGAETPPARVGTAGANCSDCGALYVPPNAKFCSKCGHARGGTLRMPKKGVKDEEMVKECVKCSETFPPGATFCVHCGERRRKKDEVGKDDTESKALSEALKRAQEAEERARAAENARREAEERAQAAEMKQSSSSFSTPSESAPIEPSPPVGKTRSQLLAEAAAENRTEYHTVNTQLCTSIDLLRTFLTKPDYLEGWTRGPLLGRGSFGSVYQGLLQNGQFVAVKQVELGSKPDGGWEKELKAIHRELGVMRMLDHPNICKFLGADYDSKEDCIFIFMEFVTGGSLSQMVKKYNLLPMPVVKQYTRDMLNGVAYLHDNGVIHRDIKGDNVLIHQEKGTVKLADFGASKKLCAKAQAARTMVGTPYWMAPEVLTQPDGYNERADIWSVGCTVVEMLTGKPPWPVKKTPQQAMMMIASGKPPSEVPTDVSVACKDFLDSCFKLAPNDRPSAKELAEHPWLKEKD